jgi:hypothetical protein
VSKKYQKHSLNILMLALSKGLVNGFEFFENDIFCQIFNTNLKKKYELKN